MSRGARVYELPHHAGQRLAMGGGPVGRLLFPALRDVKITHRWGGPFSVTLDLTPALGHLGESARGL